MASTGTMEVVDITVVVIYFILVLAIGLFAMRRANEGTVSGYFLAGRSMNWAAVGASLFVSNIGSEHFIGLAGSGAACGFSVAAWELNALLLLQVLGWVFIPVYIQCRVSTMPEYLSKRFGGNRLKVYFAALSLILYVFTKLSVDLYAGALFIQESLGWNLYLSIILLISMTALLTVTGGLVAVIYTDTVQAFIMIAGALCLTGIGLFKVGGLEGVRTKYMQASPNITAILLSSPNLTYSESCHFHPKPDALKVLRGPTDPDLPWPGFLLGQTPASIWYWCTDQVIVQRVLAAKNIAHAKGSTIMAGFLKILPMFIIVIPGMISRILFADELACISPEHCLQVCGSASGCSNLAYPRLVMSLMPVGLRGLMMAVIIAALMSDLDSIFNSASTIFTLDIYTMLRKQASSRELVMVGRLFVVFMVIASIAWVPVIIEMQGGQMFYYIQEAPFCPRSGPRCYRNSKRMIQGTIGSQVNSTEDLPVPSGDKCERLVVVVINIHPQIGKTMGKMCCSTSQIGNVGLWARRHRGNNDIVCDQMNNQSDQWTILLILVYTECIVTIV
uniref:sodium/myo-inositol cotransporter-like n=1 Tax=Gasterosteus aculeatus aculeatus TaxID=481459 RepID=UPI001A981EEE|nr:sodium/myo-inositol cotransporter-like [Gasterosteus aculeatus aculeatus]XP_040047497.1 sodium/myo-inositol cotransporter-like [Gasterosteus aculeatus aculeatus]